MVRYVCRHCGRRMGEFRGDWRDPGLGLTRLAENEQEEFLEFDDTGDHATVKILCDHCLPVPWDENLWYN